jgi:Zn-dependent peptidase ImmA (M78 family)/DNA-binding XRE family transcriptional regulator
MDSMVISINLRRLRGASSLSQAELAKRAGISRPAYRKIETGDSMPRVSTLQQIAAAMDVKIQDLMTPIKPLEAIRFRSKKKMKSREQLIADISRWLEDFNFLEEALGEKSIYRFEELADTFINKSINPENVAMKARAVLKLEGDETVRDVCGLLESSGIKIYPYKLATDDFFGLSVAPMEGGPAIIVNTWERITVERWIFSTIHELGHLLMHLNAYDVKKSDESKNEEKEADLFASYFLMPRKVFESEWSDTYGLPFMDRVLKVKRIFKVSYKTVLYRLGSDLGYKQVWKHFQFDHKKRTGTTLKKGDEPVALSAENFRTPSPESQSSREPERLSKSDFIEDRLSRLVRDAVEKDEITMSRAAEILRFDLEGMRTLAAAWA